ncbi:alpha-tocopherol transfer protein-like isoform X1 [Stigmatopora argus]
MGESACVGSSWLPGPPPPVYACTLSPELVAKAREELQEKPEWRLRDAQALRDMILKEQPDLQTRLDDAFLLRFLRARKFDYDRALRLLLNYHAGRTAWPEVFRGLRPSAVKHVLDAGFLTVLPRPDPDGRQMEGGTLPLRGQREGGVPHPGEAGAGGGHAGQRRRGLGRLQRRGRVAGLRPGAFPGQEGGGRPSGRLPGAHQGRPRGQRAPHFQRHLCADQALPEGEDGPAVHAPQLGPALAAPTDPSLGPARGVRRRGHGDGGRALLVRPANGLGGGLGRRVLPAPGGGARGPAPVQGAALATLLLLLTPLASPYYVNRHTMPAGKTLTWPNLDDDNDRYYGQTCELCQNA